jgi:hypothetical protein
MPTMRASGCWYGPVITSVSEGRGYQRLRAARRPPACRPILQKDDGWVLEASLLSQVGGPA